MAAIQRRPSGSYRVYWRDPAGRQRARHFPTLREARAFKAQVEAELAQGRYVDGHAASRTLFRDQAAAWLAGRTVEVATAARDESVLRVHVLPRWGGLPLSRIDHLAVQRWVAELGRQLAPATVRECYRVLALIRRSAVQARLLSHSPCDGVRLPARRRQDEPVTLSREEVAAKLLPEIPERFGTLVATAAYTGLRWGECAGLHWSSVDLDRRRLRVVRVLVEVGGRITPKPYPKTGPAGGSSRYPNCWSSNSGRTDPSTRRPSWCSPTASVARSAGRGSVAASGSRQCAQPGFRAT
jgi:hypothetical protein